MNGIWRQWLRFGRFNLVGLLGAALQLVLLYILTKKFQMPAVLATPVAVEITVVHNFLWHENYTWPDRGLTNLGDKVIRLWRFHAGNGLISLLGNTAITYGLVEWLRVPPLLSCFAAIAICSLVNFRLADRWVYPASPSVRRARPRDAGHGSRCDAKGVGSSAGLKASLDRHFLAR